MPKKMPKSVLVSVRLTDDLLMEIDADMRRENEELLANHPNWTDCKFSRSDIIRMALASYYANYYKK